MNSNAKPRVYKSFPQRTRTATQYGSRNVERPHIEAIRRPIGATPRKAGDWQ